MIKKEHGKLIITIGKRKIFSHKYKISQNNTDFLEKSYFYVLLDNLLNRSCNKKFYHCKKNTYEVCYTDLWEEIKYVVPHQEFYSINEIGDRIPDYILMCGTRYNIENRNALYLAQTYNLPLVLYEDGFLRSASTYLKRDIDPKYWRGISFCFDTQGAYFDATHPSLLECMLNDKTLIISNEDKKRARKCIDFIVTQKLTKYNHQPIYEPHIGRNGVKKVLVIDQSYGDMSIRQGLASDKTFKIMLNTAIKENPEADIIVKTHPDTIAGRGGYYTGLKPHDNIYTQTEAINPISLINYADKVYVCTTQLGFEALMCGKEVHVFGMPYYAGWGLTIDNQKCARRTNKRTLEEIFFIAYILYTRYYNPKTKKRCEIEEAMNYLLEIREEYKNFIKKGA